MFLIVFLSVFLIAFLSAALTRWSSFSPAALLTLLVVLVASCTTFYFLVQRLTSRRTWVALSDWGRDRGFRFTHCPQDHPPAPLDRLPAPRPAVRLCLSDGRTTLVQLHEDPAPSHAGDPRVAAQRPGWNLLLRPIESDWPPTGVRPVANPASILDRFSLLSFPTLLSSERFVVYSVDSLPARRIARSSLRPLLPPDIGLLLHGRHMLLDFSARPFDPLEFDRLIALADQLIAHLPEVAGAAKEQN